MSSWACCEHTENEAAILCPTLSLSLQVNSGGSVADPVSFLHMHQIVAWITLQAPSDSLRAGNSSLHPRSDLWSPDFSSQPSQMAQKVKDPPTMQETQETWVKSLFRKICSRRKWQPTPVFLPGKSHGQRSLASYSPKGCEELDTAEHLCPPADIPLRLRIAVRWPGPSLQVSLCSTCCRPVAVFSLKPLKLSFSPHWSPLLVKRFPVSRNISSFIAPSQGYRSYPNSPFLSFLLPCYLVIFLAFWFYELFCQHLAGILWALFYIHICLWKEVSSMSFYCTILLWSLICFVLFFFSNFCGPTIYCYK